MRSLIKRVRSRYLDIGQVLFLPFVCLFNKELITCLERYSLLRMTDSANNSRERGKIVSPDYKILTVVVTDLKILK